MDKRYGLLGEYLGHSFSREVHQALGAYSYDLIEVAPEDLSDFMNARDFSGLSVTIPYKQAVMEYLDEIDPLAKAIGAVNTVYWKGDVLHGTNTDYAGFLYMADRASIDFNGKKVLVLGTGGASHMVIKAVSDRNAKEIIVATSHEPSASLEEELTAIAGGKPLSLVSYDRIPSDIRIIVNGTPVGMFPKTDGHPLPDLDRFARLEGVLDLIYNPARTSLLLSATDAGVPCSGGLPMLVAQATVAADHFTGRRDDFDTSSSNSFTQRNEELLGDLLLQTRNISLVGMPGSGKTTLGRKLAEHFGLPFIDTDERIQQETGRSPSEIISADGEAAFRRVESEVIAGITKEHGRIIATGGGAILREENRRALRQSGPVIFVRCPLGRLATAGRPLSQSGDLLELYKKRLPLYEQCSDGSILNDRPFDAVLKQLSAIL